MDRLGEWLDEGSVSGAVNDVGLISGTRSWKICEKFGVRCPSLETKLESKFVDEGEGGNRKREREREREGLLSRLIYHQSLGRLSLAVIHRRDAICQY